MRAMCFEIKAPFGTFKDPRTTTGYFSFPFPPKTALIGLLAGVLGIPHNECYKTDHFLAKAKISIQLLTVPQFIACQTSETQTKTVQTVYGMKIGYPSSGLDRGFVAPQTSSLLINVWYRVFACMEEEKQVNLSRRLKEHEYIFPPYLGRANMLAEIDYIGEAELQSLDAPKKNIPVISVFDIGAVAEIGGSYVVVPNMPNAYETEEKEYEVDKQRIHAIQVRTGSLASMAYGKGDDSKEIQVTPSPAGMKRTFRIAVFKSCPALVGKHLVFFPD